MATEHISSLYGRAARAVRSVFGYMRAVTGANKYQIYLDYHEANHPGCQPLSEKDFWDGYWNNQANRPGSRCC